jgi:hypothetical protein
MGQLRDTAIRQHSSACAHQLHAPVLVGRPSAVKSRHPLAARRTSHIGLRAPHLIAMFLNAARKNCAEAEDIRLKSRQSQPDPNIFLGKLIEI